MRSIKVIAPVAFVSAAAVIGLVSAMPAASSSATGSTPARYDGPVASAAGGDVVASVYPSIVNVRLVRAQAALDRASTLADQSKGTAAVSAELADVRTQMSAAWTAAKYVIQTAPPPAPAPDDRAGANMVVPDGGYAAPEPTALAVLTLQHDVITTSLGLLDVAPSALQTQLKATVRAALSGRDAAVAYIHSVAPPPPPADDKAGAQVNGAPVAAGWESVMPTATLELDDEVQQLTGMRAINPKLTPVLLRSARSQAIATRNTINQYWPPLPADD
jgi:hypothetical protein